MLWKNIKESRKAGLAKRNKIRSLFVMIGIAVFMMAGCSDVLPEAPESEETAVDHEDYPLKEEDFDNAESIAAVYHDIYDEAVETNTLGSMETVRRIVARLGENGYVAVDSGNQVDMTETGQVEKFCRAVDGKKSAALTIVVIQAFGFRKFDLETEDGNVNVVRGYYQYDQNGAHRIEVR